MRSRNFSFYVFLGFSLFFTASCFLWSSPSFPPASYNVSKRWVSHYEDNYFVKVPSSYQLLDEKTLMSMVLQQVLEDRLDPDDHFAFQKNDQFIAGMFRSKTNLEAMKWAMLFERSLSGTNSSDDLQFLEKLGKEVGLSTDEIHLLQFQNFQNYLVGKVTLSEPPAANLYLAFQPYATEKGGSKDGLFLFFLWTDPSVSQDVGQKEMETFLENTVLSYFLNYERTLEKNLDFD